MGALTGTGYSGNWYYVVGSVASVAGELNRINAKPQNISISATGLTSTTVVALVGRP